MNQFQSNHLLKILSAYQESSFPIDTFVSRYFRKNRALGSKDRRKIANTLFALIRWQGLLDFLSPQEPSWEKRFHLYHKIDPLSFINRQEIPIDKRVSFPKWIVDRLIAQYGEESTLSFCLASNQKAPITVRANLLKTSRKALLAAWEKTYAISPCLHAPAGIQFNQPIHLPLLPEFKAGLFEVQDEGSQLIADHLNVKEGDHVLDYCAGSGGKTLAFAHKMSGKGQIYLYDSRPHILVEAKKRLKRAGVQNAHIVTRKQLKKPRFQARMDWILLDVPCSGSGTFRRNPDAKWRLSPQVLDHLISEQRKIFSQALSFLRPNGKIVYATCSVFSEENAQQVVYFTQNYSLTPTRPWFSSQPKAGGMDGFFCAVLKQKES
ncbi:MAG: RsmB/NOP family class I SAM-dependent RNA methyltransferase [Chlamydiota bacterium]